MPILDVAIVVVYLAVILCVAIWLGLRQTPGEFLVNDRRTKLWFLIGSVVSTNVGAATYVGITSASYATGISYPLSATFAVVLGFMLVAVVAPYLRRQSAEHHYYTMGDFFSHRYSRRCQLIASGILFVAYLLFTAAQVRAAGLMLNHWGGVSLEIAVWTAGLTMIGYTALAGIKSDLYTDVVHFCVMAVGLLVLAFRVLGEAGGLPEILAVNHDHFDAFAYGGPVFFFGSIVFGLPLMLSSMEVWQRLFAAVDERTAKRAMYGAAAVNLVFLVVPTVLGLAALRMWPGRDSPDSTFFLLLDLLPSGLLGLATAALLAAILSTANSMIMVLGAIVSRDFLRIEPAGTDRRRTMWKLRLATMAVGLLALVFASGSGDLVSTMVGGFQVIVVLAPAILFGIFSKRLAERAAFWSMVAGAAITAVAFPFLGATAFVPGVLFGVLVFGLGLGSPKPAAGH